jgi:hypothetical protein
MSFSFFFFFSFFFVAKMRLHECMDRWRLHGAHATLDPCVTRVELNVDAWKKRKESERVKLTVWLLTWSRVV